MQNTSSKEVAEIYESIHLEGKHITADNLRLSLSRTRKFAGDIAGLYKQAMQIDDYLSRRLYSMTGRTSRDGSSMHRWEKEEYGSINRELTLESVLNTFHPILDNLTRYLSTRDLIKLANTCSTLQSLLYSHRSTWRCLDFSSHPSSNRRLELLKSHRRIGFNLQNQAIYPEIGFTSELAVELLFKIPLSHLRYLVLDGTDIGDAALKLYLSRGRSTLAYVSIRNCGHLNPGGLLEYFSRVNEGGFPRALKTLKLRGIPGVLRSSTRSDFVEGESDLGEAISGLFKVLGNLNIKIDVGFCVASIDFCQTILENYPHATEGDGVIGVKKKRRCGTCKKARVDAYCKICEGERTCKTCEEVGEPTFLCRECEPDSWDGVIWPYYCECGRALCTLCFDRFTTSYQHCPCFQCKECDRDQYLWPEERLTVKRYRCDHCGLDKCPTCWASTGIKLKKCIECDRSLCEVCGVKLACIDCNACVCEDCYNPTEYPNIAQGNDWHCEYCRGTVNDIKASSLILSDLNSCLTCAYFGKEAQTHTTTLCECNLSPIRPTRHLYVEQGDSKERSLESPWTVAKKKRPNTDITAGTSDDQSIAKRIRLENTTENTRYGDTSGPCTII